MHVFLASVVRAKGGFWFIQWMLYVRITVGSLMLAIEYGAMSIVIWMAASEMQ
jgi:hypothetical protein